jgi:P-type Ca2+ transporter type 2C
MEYMGEKEIEPIEGLTEAKRSIYVRRSRTLKTKLFDKTMLRGVAISGLSLFAGVMTCFYFAIWQHMPVDRAQTFAFTAWIAGHVFLAFVSRSQHEPLIKLGLFSNHVMDLWAIVAFAFLFIVLCIPAAGVNLHLTALAGRQFAFIMIVSFVAIFWQELVKMIKYHGPRAK